MTVALAPPILIIFTALTFPVASTVDLKFDAGVHEPESTVISGVAPVGLYPVPPSSTSILTTRPLAERTGCIVAVLPVTVPVGGAITIVGAEVHRAVAFVAEVLAAPAGGAMVRLGLVHVPAPLNTREETDVPVTTAAAVTFVHHVRVTVGGVVVEYPDPGVVIVALRSVVRGAVVPLSVARAIALPVPVGALTVIVGVVVHVPVPPNVTPVREPPLIVAVAVTFVHHVRVTVGALV